MILNLDNSLTPHSPRLTSMLSVTKQHPYFSDWIMDNLINMYIQDYGNYIKDDFISNDDFYKNSLLEKNVINYEIINTLEENLYKFIKKLIEKKYYCICTINKFYIKSFENHMSAHNMLFYGINNIQKKVYVKDFHKGDGEVVNYQNFIIKKRELIKSNNGFDTVSYDRNFDKAFIFKLNNESYHFSFKKMKNDIESFLNSHDDSINDHHIYIGLDSLSFFKNKIMEQEKFIFRPMNLLQIQFELWLIRIDYLLQLNILNKSEYLLLSNTIKDSMNIIKFIKIKELRYRVKCSGDYSSRKKNLYLLDNIEYNLEFILKYIYNKL